MFENFLNSEGYTTNVFDMFHEKPWIGVAVPPVIHISFRTMGHAWSCNRQKAEEIKKVLDLKVPFDPDTPVAAYGVCSGFGRERCASSSLTRGSGPTIMRSLTR